MMVGTAPCMNAHLEVRRCLDSLRAIRGMARMQGQVGGVQHDDAPPWRQHPRVVRCTGRLCGRQGGGCGVAWCQ